MADAFFFAGAYDAAKAEMQARDPRLTDVRSGSSLDALLGAIAAGTDVARTVSAQRFADQLVATAEGSALDAVITDREPACTRAPAAAATTMLTVTRDTYVGAYTVLAGSQASGAGADGRRIVFEVDADVVLGSGDSSADVAATAVATGTAYNVAAGTIDTLDGLPSGLTLDQADRAAGGSDVESDDDYRARYRLLRQGGGNGRLQDIEAAARAVPGVSYVSISEDFIADEDGGYVAVYVGDPDAEGNSALCEAVEDALGRFDGTSSVRAGGVEVRAIASEREELTFTLTCKARYGKAPTEAALQTAFDRYVSSLEPGEVWYADACEAAVRLVVDIDGTRIASLVAAQSGASERSPTAAHKAIRMALPTDVTVTISEVA